MNAMRRARLTEIGWNRDLIVEEAPPSPPPVRDEIVVAVEACGVCHRDLIDRAGRFAFMRTPITPGHEAAGRVVAVGPEVTEWRVGDRVASMHRDSCGRCDACRAGETSLCLSAAAVLGLIVDGGYASELRAPQRAFYRLPDDLDPAQAAIFHCTVGTAYRGLRRAGALAAGARVLVTGANGGVGLAAIQVASRHGATVVAVVRRDEHRALATEMGAAHVIVDGGDRFHKQLPGGAVDAALDCVGAPTFNAALRSLRVGGRIVAVGNVVEQRVDVNLGYLITRGIQITGSSGATRAEMDELVALHRTRPFHVPIHARLPLDDADRGQRLVAAGGLHGRIVLEMTGSAAPAREK